MRGQPRERYGYIDTCYGLACVHDDVYRTWQAAVRFWECASNLAGVLDLATELMAPGGSELAAGMCGLVRGVPLPLLDRERDLLRPARETGAHADGRLLRVQSSQRVKAGASVR
jgi:hypothetical protein